MKISNGVRQFVELDAPEPWFQFTNRWPNWLLNRWPGVPIQRLLCRLSEHEPITDHCGKPEHDYCAWCQMSMPYQADRPHESSDHAPDLLEPPERDLELERLLQEEEEIERRIKHGVAHPYDERSGEEEE